MPKFKFPQMNVHLSRILEAAISFSNSMKGLKVNGNRKVYYLEPILIKAIAHMNSIWHLSRGVNILESKKTLFDSYSPLVLARSIFETYCTFFYIYIDGNSSDLSDFRFDCWWYSGLIQRHSLNPKGLDDSELERLSTEKSSLEALLQKILDHQIYKSLEKYEQEKVKRGKWRLKHWNQIGLDAGMHKLYAHHMYRYMSAYSHSTSLSLLQLSQSKNNQENLVSALQLASVSAAFLLKDYKKVLPNCGEDISQAQLKTINFWHKMGKLPGLGEDFA